MREVGALLLERDDSSEPAGGVGHDWRERGAVYTPQSLADWAAQLLINQVGKGALHVLDLGCGDGALLAAVRERDPEAHPKGIELHRPAALFAESRFGGGSVIAADVLKPGPLGEGTLSQHWLGRLDAQPNGVIMNPPWGGAHNLTKADARRYGLTLAQGQFDTYDLFCELALQLLPSDGAYVFILPDSVLLPEHEPLRRLLLTTTIKVLARLGEGVFSNIYRGCFVICGTVGEPSKDHVVECLRITKSNRLEVQAGSSIDSLRPVHSHFVPQSRFRADPYVQFDIDVRDGDTSVEKMQSYSTGWTSLLNSRRGVELSKKGQIVVCAKCSFARPAPKRSSERCLNCGTSLTEADPETIVSFEKPKGDDWHPFIVGEDVNRYAVSPSRWIKHGVRGVAYKRLTPKGTERLLIRKTGIGLYCALDISGAYTNQVVFEYVENERCSFPFSYLRYVLGVLNSRIMFGYHLKRTGELEWRSHPYMTQKTLAALPVPIPSTAQMRRQAKAIADAVDRRLQGCGNELEIEGLVAGLYQLGEGEVRGLLRAIAEAADLAPMRNLRLKEGQSVVPAQVR